MLDTLKNELKQWKLEYAQKNKHANDLEDELRAKDREI